MKLLLKSFAFTAAICAGFPSLSYAGACGPGWGTGQTVGTIAGAAAGGVIGNQFGKGSGKDAATALGVIAGGVVGNQAGASVDASNCPPPAPAPVAADPPPVYAPAPTVVYQAPPPPPAVVEAPPPQVGLVWIKASGIGTTADTSGARPTGSMSALGSRMHLPAGYRSTAAGG